jgi:RimJ/RimL family protein N-acetyltransferase
VSLGPELTDELFDLFQAPGIARWHGGPWTREQAEKTAADMGRGRQLDGVHKWLAYRRNSDEVIGRCGLSLARTANGPQLEIGWAVRERCWGQGYATEIGNAGLAYAFNELDAAHVISFTESTTLARARSWSGSASHIRAR